MFLSVPEYELPMFERFRKTNIEIISDESYAGQYLASSTGHGFSLGYVNQEICKLCFWEADFAENYLCVDSDAAFIRDFYVSDFMADERTPYTVLVMDKDLCVEHYYQDFWNHRQRYIQKIYDEVDLKDRRLRTCHGMQNLNSRILQSLKEDFMSKKSFDYKDLIEISPFEFTWYNAWFQKCGLIKEVAVEPFFKTFHTQIEYTFSRLKRIGITDLARSYVGIIMNSNWGGGAYKSPTFTDKVCYKLLGFRK
jgi:hypothetical protein